ncbi:RagB/SusD family nutrient uptake outer membrane protein [Sphingobacterium cellulitidis]|uniref:RagB/SusD family nutrient uptake outer membrane protein n=1 Tax=Sphingobacterium cellulitidis TaxID=1768011 RepID=UPI000B93DC7B|nr:hypothetical protein CHT99_08780 [Sphingobacterium cellulitidis]
MKRKYITNKWIKATVLMLALSPIFTSCEKGLEYRDDQELNGSNFLKTENDVTSAVTAMYSGIMQGSMWNGYGATMTGITTQAGQTTDEAICNWDDAGRWKKLNMLNFDPDFSQITQHYVFLMRYTSRITTLIPQIEGVNMNEDLKKRYIAELKGLRGFFMQIMYLYYGPVPVVLDPSLVNTPESNTIPRPTKEAMIGFIEKDFKEAIAVLPAKFEGADYGRFSKSACLTALMKLYMQEKRWADAIEMGKQIKAIGFSLTPKYEDNFNMNNKGGNDEIILAVVANATSSTTGNGYRPHYLPTDYYDVTVGGGDAPWGGYRMPWKTYDQFNKADYRLKLLLEKYPTMQGGKVVYRDARAGGDIGAVMDKYGPDPAKVSSMSTAVDVIVYRYADVELLYAEALNELNGPTSEAYTFLNDVRTVHGKLPALSGLTKDTFRKAVQNERLFELWEEGVRRDDLIRWGLYVQRAKDDGYTPGDHVVLYPLPRAAVNQSNGAVKQNPGYN